MNHYTRMVDHIAKLAMTPGWRAYAKEWAQELQACKSGVWSGLVAAVRLRLASLSAAPKNGASEP